MPPRRSSLADGREILYFDDPGAERPAPLADRRKLPPRGAATELRHDPLTDEQVLVAAGRQERTFLPPDSDCPLCPSQGEHLTEIPDPEYDVVVFENRFPSLPGTARDRPAAGRAEVVCYSSRHDTPFASMSDERLRTIGNAWAERTAELSGLAGIAQVLIFENRGEEIGVTLHHPHGQIYAYPFVPPRLARMVEAANRRLNADGGCLACELLEEELVAATRIVSATEHGVAFVPEAARWPWQIHVMPRRHVPDLADLDPGERDDLLLIQADMLRRLDALFARPAPYMAGWLQAPLGVAQNRLHLRLEIISPLRATDRLKYLAGSEVLAGAFINDIRPEEAAERLRSMPHR